MFVFCIWLLIKSPGVYKGLLGVLVSALRLWKFFILMFIYIASCIYLLSRIGVWDTSLLKITIFWIFGGAVVMFSNSTKIGKDEEFLRRTLLEIFGLAAIISFISNFYSLPLGVELVMVPLVLMFAGMSVLAPYKPEYKSIRVFSNGVLIFLGLGALLLSVYKTILNLNEFITPETFKEFAVPILLSLMFLPFIYFLSFYSRWEQKRIRQIYLGKSD